MDPSGVGHVPGKVSDIEPHGASKPIIGGIGKNGFGWNVAGKHLFKLAIGEPGKCGTHAGFTVL